MFMFKNANSYILFKNKILFSAGLQVARKMFQNGGRQLPELPTLLNIYIFSKPLEIT